MPSWYPARTKRRIVFGSGGYWRARPLWPAGTLAFQHHCDMHERRRGWQVFGSECLFVKHSDPNSCAAVSATWRKLVQLWAGYRKIFGHVFFSLQSSALRHRGHVNDDLKTREFLIEISKVVRL